MATRTTILDTTTSTLAGQLDIDVFGPNRLSDIPDPTGDPRNPTTFVAWAFGEEVWDEDFSSFATRIYTGELLFGIHTEHAGGELDFASYAEQIEDLMIAATTADLTFFEAKHGDVIEDDNWSGRVLTVPYLRQEDKA